MRLFKKKQQVRIFESETGFRWQLFDGKDLAATGGDGFPDAESCREAWFEAAELALQFFGGGQADSGRFSFYEEFGGISWFFKSPLGEIVAKSALPFPSLSRAERSAEMFTSAAIRWTRLPVVMIPPESPR